MQNILKMWKKLAHFYLSDEIYKAKFKMKVLIYKCMMVIIIFKSINTAYLYNVIVIIIHFI